MTIKENQLLNTQTRCFLWVLTLLALVIRLISINAEGLWLDELHTMNESDPEISWDKLMWYLRYVDQHPPMHFAIEKVCFSIFGYTPLVARVPSAIAGALSVWAIFYLGRELRSQRAGLFAAIITAVNGFHLYYSQEARNYVLAFLFAILSFLWLVKLLKDISVRNSVMYGLMTVLFLYTHYFSLFAVVSQAVIIAIFFLAEPKENKARFFKTFLISAVIIVLGYLPWFSHLLSMKAISSFWIKPVKPDFLIDYFKDYFFGQARVAGIAFLAVLFYLGYSLYTGRRSLNFHNLRQRPAAITMLTLFLWFFITLLIPYLRSVFVIPMLIIRYTIIVLPVIFLAIAFGFDMLPKKVLSIGGLAAFAFLNLWSVFHDIDLYNQPSKTQFREMQRYVMDHNKENYPLITGSTRWHQEYYWKYYEYSPSYLPGSPTNIVDSVLRKIPPVHDLKGFWVVGAHGATPLSAEQQADLDTAYTLLHDEKWIDAWAQLWIRKEANDLNSK